MNNNERTMRNKGLGVRNERMVRSGRVVRKAGLSSFLIPLFSFLIISLLAGCQNPADSFDNPTPIPAGKGSVSLTIPGAGGASRTILPETPHLSDFAVYNLAFTLASGGTPVEEERTNANLSNPIYLAPGNYNLVVSAYKDSAKTLHTARGIRPNIIIKPGENTSAIVTLEALLTGGTGTFKWNITLPSGVTSATMKISPANAGGTAEQTVDLLTGAASGSRVLNCGQYNITFNLEKPINAALTKKVVWKELLYVYQNLDSVHVFEFTNDHFIQQNYTVTFVSNGGSAVGEQTVLHGGKATNNTPTRSGTSAYTFGGWYTDNGYTSGVYNNPYNFDTPIIDDITLYARWYSSVTFNNNGGNGSITTLTPNFNQSVTLPNASGMSRSGFEFDGWSTANNASGTQYAAGATFTPTGNVTFYPRWKCTITFNVNNGTGTPPAAMTAYANASITLPTTTMTRSGYTFDSWNSNTAGNGTVSNAGTTFSTPATGNTTLYARWLCTITYNGNSNTGGSVPASTTAYNNTTVTLRANSLTRTNYAFGGWNTQANGNGTNYAASSSYTPSGNITLYAKWVKTSYAYSNSTEREVIKWKYINDRITSDFDLAALQSAGYTGFTIAVSFEIRQEGDAWIRSCVHPGHLADPSSPFNTNPNGPTSGSGGISSSAWGGTDRNDAPSNGNWTTISYSVNRALSQFQNTFTVQTDVYSTDANDNVDRHWLRNMYVTVTAYR